MGRILVPPERLMEISQQFAQAREIGVQICSHLTQQIQILESGWEGTTRQRFYQNFQLARQQMDNFTAAVGSVSTELTNIVHRFTEADSTQASLQARAADDPFDHAHNVLDTSLRTRDNLEKWGTLLYSSVGASLVLSNTVRFRVDPRDPTRAKIHNAPWVKGKGNNTFLKNLARSINRQIVNPGLIMKGVKGFDAVASKLGLNFGLGFSQAKNFPQWTRQVIAGVEKGRYGIKTSKIPGMIAKKIFPINATFNVIGEASGLVSKHRDGKLNGEEVAVAASNVVVKTAVTYGGAVLGGAAGAAIAGPVGAAVGSYIGGTLGAFAGDAVAGFAEKGVRWVSGLFK
ncbi:WXG100 family type VII secretion target [Paenibacillus sp. 7541]|uniref:WXG100 family type VII secretion target n=1 Tax=Paenibacillus TaxID=44249 RepID=UPI000BA6876A|nr:WXG100 family type VII secretion target [Paenibacillus sp. 7541]PAK55060.1 virulence factor EsxA [Paenibacillus sp. 7541]